MIDRVAKRFKHNEQPLDNARDVIRAIMCPTGYEPSPTFQDFCRFLAMFGPQQTIMVKIAALLTCSNDSGKWLTFDCQPGSVRALPYAAFDENQPNCLVVRHVDQGVDRVYNDPNVDANNGMYLMDDAGKTYSGWADYFSQKPVRSGFTPYHI
jgi:hypothetical protein